MKINEIHRRPSSFVSFTPPAACFRLCACFFVRSWNMELGYEHSERARAPHTSGPSDVPRWGALSLLQKPLNYRGGSSELVPNIFGEKRTRPCVSDVSKDENASLIQRSRHPIRVPSTPAQTHAQPTHKAHRAPTIPQLSSRFDLRNARAYSSTRRIGFCAKHLGLY